MPQLCTAAFSLDFLFQPGNQIASSFLRHGKGMASFHFTFFVAIKAMPILYKNGALFEVHFLGGSHHHLRFDPEPQHTVRTGKQILHGKGVQGGNKEFFHSLFLHQSLHLIQQLSKQLQGLIHRFGGSHIHTGAFQQVNGAFAAAAGQEIQIIQHSRFPFS